MGAVIGLWTIHAATSEAAMVAVKLGGREPQTGWEAMKGASADSFVMLPDTSSLFAGH